MMNKLILVLIGLSWLTSSFQQANNTQGPDEKIGFSGQVILYNEFGVEVANKSGVKVAVLNDNPGVFDFTDKAGNFVVRKVTEGKHRVLFSKDGYGSYKTMEYNMSPGPVVNYRVKYKLGQVSSTVVSNLSAKIINNAIVIKGAVAPAGTKKQPRCREYFFGKSPTVSKENHVLAVGSLGTTSATFEELLSVESLKKRGFKSGETVYVLAHGNTIEAMHYTDPVSKKIIYPALNLQASNVTSFVLP